MKSKNITLEDLFKDRSKEEISAFAYNIGRSIETLIKAESKGIGDANKILKGKILHFRQKLQDIETTKPIHDKQILREFDEHFNIHEVT